MGLGGEILHPWLCPGKIYGSPDTLEAGMLSKSQRQGLTILRDTLIFGLKSQLAVT